MSTSGSFDGFDLADWDQVGADANANDPFGPGGPGAGDPGTLSATDITMLEALGWKPASQAPVNPTITAQNFSVSPKQAIALANELSVPNPSGDSLTKYWVTDLGHGSGHLTVEGVSEADGRWVQAASNWSNVQYVGGSAAGTDQLEVAVYDATTGSVSARRRPASTGRQRRRISAPGPNRQKRCSIIRRILASTLLTLRRV